jgi:hypothetical protein
VLFKEIIAVYTDNHTKIINIRILIFLNTEFFPKVLCFVVSSEYSLLDPSLDLSAMVYADYY